MAKARAASRLLGASVVIGLTCLSVLSPAFSQGLLPVPLRIKMGAPGVSDSFGRPWLGDPGDGADVLNIRPVNNGGALTIPNWCAPSAASLEAVGHPPADAAVFNSIRWDNSGDGDLYVLELPVANGTYDVSLYFCDTDVVRHERIEIQDVLVAADVHALQYAGGTHQVGRLTFPDIVVAGEILKIALLSCPDPLCPGGLDPNPLLSALEVQQSACAPCCDALGPRQCPLSLTCALGPARAVEGTWQAPICHPSLIGYEVYRDGAVLTALPAGATSFSDTLPLQRATVYRLVPLTGAPPECPGVQCTVVDASQPFTVPLRINMGGPTTTDSRGRLWLGDGPGAGDPLEIRPDDLGGSNWIERWCTAESQTNADSLKSLGLDPYDPADQGIFNTIRWDDGAHPSEYALELPVANGAYLLSGYFTECCCPNRHFSISVEGVVVDPDVSSADYSRVPRLGRTGRLTLPRVPVADGSLSIKLLPCPDPTCPGGTDGNSILDAIEVLPAGSVLEACPRDLLCSMAGGNVEGSWLPPLNVVVDGYDVYRNGVLIASLPGSATGFSDTFCARNLSYEVRPRSAEVDAFCPGIRLRCTVINPDCPFAAPVRINSGGPERVDSHGQVWLGDEGAGDPLSIRPVDAGGDLTLNPWCAAAPDSVTGIGFDGGDAQDVDIFSSIRWDNAGVPADFLMELPIPRAEYEVNLYFIECCCDFRHFTIALEETVVEPDVSSADYGGVVRAARLSFPGILVRDGVLDLDLLPCPTCPGAGDTNAIVGGIEVIRTGVLPPFQLIGDCTQEGQRNISDVICMIRQIFAGFFLLDRTQVPLPCPGVLSSPGNQTVLDWNGDVRLDVSDIVGLARFLFQGGNLPPLGLDCRVVDDCDTDPGCEL